MITVSVDLGASYSKMVVWSGSKIVKKVSKKTDTLGNTSDYLIKWLMSEKISPDKIIATGGRSKSFPREVFVSGKATPITIVPEMEAIARGGDIKGKGLVVSVGTGTAIAKWDAGYAHVGGTGLGGGTLLGLGKLLTGVSTFEELEALARKGKREGADLTIGDILGTGLGSLSNAATASNFGRAVFGNVSPADCALGCFSIVAETVVVIASRVSLATGIDLVVISGKTATSSVFKNCLTRIGRDMHLNLRVHRDPQYAMALGAYQSVQG